MQGRVPKPGPALMPEPDPLDNAAGAVLNRIVNPGDSYMDKRCARFSRRAE